MINTISQTMRVDTIDINQIIYNIEFVLALIVLIILWYIFFFVIE